MRKEHVLRKVGAKPWPDLALVVQCQMEQRYATDADATGQLRLAKWRIAPATVDAGKLEWGQDVTGTKEDRFWQVLHGLAGTARRVWIVSRDARDHAAGLGLWDRIGDSSLTLSGADPWGGRQAGGVNDIGSDGYVVLESPPTVICFRRAGGDTIFTWLDPENYGAGIELGSPSEQLRRDRLGECGGAELAIYSDDLDVLTCRVADWLSSYFAAVKCLQLGGPCHTAASQAAEGFRHSYLKDKIVIHNHYLALPLERQAIFGGRCECGYVGSVFAQNPPANWYGDPDNTGPYFVQAGAIYHLDVRSMYPSLAQNARLPIRLMGVLREPLAQDAEKIVKSNCVVASVQIETETPCVPCQLNGNTVFPIGLFDTWLTAPEIVLALSCGAKIDYRFLCVYEDAVIYRDWVNCLWPFRKLCEESGEPGMASVTKRLLNSSFGKWAQLTKRWTPYPECLPPAPYCQWWEPDATSRVPTQCRAIGWQTQRLAVVGEGNESFPAITATINALGRAELWRLLGIAGLEQCYYWDTDSIFCSARGYARLHEAGEVKDDELGKLTVKGQYQNVRFIGRQAYVADGRLTLSGTTAKSLPDGDMHAKQLRLPPIQHYLLAGQAPGIDRHVASVRVNREYKHGHVSADGWTTPIRIDPRGRKS